MHRASVLTGHLAAAELVSALQVVPDGPKVGPPENGCGLLPSIPTNTYIIHYFFIVGLGSPPHFFIVTLEELSLRQTVTETNSQPGSPGSTLGSSPSFLPDVQAGAPERRNQSPVVVNGHMWDVAWHQLCGPKMAAWLWWLLSCEVGHRWNQLQSNALWVSHLPSNQPVEAAVGARGQAWRPQGQLCCSMVSAAHLFLNPPPG